MTGRDLIIYILQNDLLDAPVYDSGRLLGFMTAIEAAAKFHVGLATIYAWASRNDIPSARIGEDLYIYVNATNPMSNT
jgi:hypothetical protein